MAKTSCKKFRLFTALVTAETKNLTNNDLEIYKLVKNMQSLNLPFSCIYIKANNNLPHAIHVPLPLPLPSESFTTLRFSKRIYQNDNQLFKAPRYCSLRQWLVFVHRCSPRMWRERLTFLQQMLQYFSICT